MCPDNNRCIGGRSISILPQGGRAMKNILILTILNIKRYYYAVILSVFGAAVISMLLYSMGNLVSDATLAKIKVGVIDNDDSTLSEDFKRYMAEELSYQLIEDNTYDELTTELLDKDISVIIEIPGNFKKLVAEGGKPEVTITSLEDYENAAFVEAYINSYLSSIQVLAAGAGGNEQSFDQLLAEYPKDEIILTQTAAAEVDTEELFGESGFINSVGFFLMFIFTISVILAYMVVEDKIKGVFNRIQITPVKPVQYIIGSGVFGMVLSIITVGLFVLFIFIMDIKTGIPLGTILFMLLQFSLFTVCFSLLIALATQSKNAVTAIIIGFSTIGCILGGAYFSLDMAPDPLQKMARVLPQYWFMDAFRRIQADPLANIYPNVIIITLFIILSFLIGAVLFSQQYKNS
jgi:ABC-2 type transport system permease protein